MNYSDTGECEMLAPSQATCENWSTVQDAVAWAGTSEAVWKQAATALGDPELSNLLVLAGVSDEDYRTAINGITPPVTPLQKSSLNLSFNAVKTKMGVPTQILETLASGGTLTVASPSGGQQPSMQDALVPLLPMTMPPIPKIKLSQIIDQSLETEVPMLGEGKLRELRAAYEVKFGDAPMESTEVPYRGGACLLMSISACGGPSGPGKSAE